MDNQHKLIKGYRDLTKGEIDLINAFKASEAAQLELMAQYANLPDINQRSLNIAKTKLQESFMWLIRAVARPNGE